MQAFPSTTSAANYTVERYARTTNYVSDDMNLLAVVRYQGGWIVHCFTADDVTLRRVATRDYAERLAAAHADAVTA
jgi:hypothetical protein